MTILELLQQNHELVAAYAAILVAIFAIIFSYISSKKIHRQQNAFQVTRARFEVIEQARNEMKEKVTKSDFLNRQLVRKDKEGTLGQDTIKELGMELLEISTFAVNKLDKIEHHLSDDRRVRIKNHHKAMAAEAGRTVDSDFQSSKFLQPTLDFPHQLLEVLDQELGDLKKRLYE